MIRMQDTIYRILAESPGLSGADLHEELTKRSRAAAWFGEDSVWTVVFGPTLGGMYATLDRMERQGLVTSTWGVATPERGGNRPRHHYLIRN